MDTKSGKKRVTKRAVWLTISGVLLVLLIIGGVQAYRVLYKPQSLFTVSTMKPNTLSTPIITPEPEETSAPTSPASSPSLATTKPANTPTPTEPVAKEILNVLLIGIDRTEDGGKSSNGPTDHHADVIMVVAINFKENKVDLISIPRDTFVHAPEIMNGIYKINGSFNVGGGFEAKNGEGFLKVRDAAQYMLGGIPIDYYYAVDFKAVEDVVNTIGGVDYDVESSAYTLDGKGGQRHMNGEDVLFYLRVRKQGPEQGDKNRVNRQKKMMIAILSQLKKNGKLSMVPDLISAANSGIYTNTTIEQTLALVKYASEIDPNSIGMHSMTGTLLNKAGWAFSFTDQEARTELIRQIYGQNVQQQVHCTSRYADWLVNYGFSGMRYLKTGKQLLDYADQHRNEFTAEQRTAFDALKTSLADTQTIYDRTSLTLGKNDNNLLASSKKYLKSAVEKLAKLLDYKEPLKWTYNSSWWNDRSINEIPVDFR